MSEFLKAAQGWMKPGGSQQLSDPIFRVQMAVENMLGHLEAQEEQSQVETTPSAATSPRQSGVWLSASAAANLADWLQRFRPLTTTGGFRLTVQPGKLIFSAWGGAGTLTIPTGTPEPPSISGSEQDEPGDRGQAQAGAECEHDFVRTWKSDEVSALRCWKCGLWYDSKMWYHDGS